MRLLYVSSTRAPWFVKGTSAADHFAKAPYSIDAIGYYLEKLGWTVAWLGMADSKNPFQLAKEIDTFKPDIIYTYGSTTAVWPIFLKRMICRHRAFIVVHGWDDDYRRIWGEMLGKAGWWLMAVMEKFIIKHSDAVVTLSRHLMKRGAEWGVACKYIPNGADPVSPEHIKGTITLEGRFNLVYTGDKARWKKTEDVCKAMQELPDEVKLYLTGNWPDYLTPYLSSNCINLGFLTKNEQYHVMSQADAFVVTSDQDCNAKLQEYMRWHKPIVGYDGQLGNIFTNMKDAVLVKSDGYAEGIGRLAADPGLCAELAKNAEADLPVYSWAEIAQEFDAFFKGLLANGEIHVNQR